MAAHRLVLGRLMMIGLLSFAGACSDSFGTDTTTITATSAAVSDPVPSSTVFGRAQLSLSTVSAGDRITVTPAAEIQPLCLDMAIVYTSSDGALVRVGALGPGPTLWQDDRTGPTPTFPPCLPPRTSSPVTYIVPAPLGAGRYVICLSGEPDDNACGSFTVES